ncbi:MAG: PPC domain-containing protein [Cystobacter sp.]
MKLTAGQTVHSLLAPTGGQLLYALDVPANQNTVTFTTTGGPGDADMFVAFGTEPTTTQALCTSAQSSSVETCTVAGQATAGTWYVLLSATSAFSNVSLTGNYQAGPANSPSVQSLSLDQRVTGVSGAVGHWRTYSLQVPTGQAVLNVGLSGGTGDADLFLRQGSAPSLTDFTCRSSNTDNTERCSVNAPQAGIWYVMVRGKAAFSGAELLASVTPVITPLVNGQPVTGLSGSVGASSYFTLEVPAGQNLLKVTLTGGTGDADLYLRRGALPTTSDYNCRSIASGTAETCSVTSPQAGTWYILARAYSAFSGATLLATANDGLMGSALTNGQSVSNLSSNNGSPSLFRLDVPAEVAQVRFEVPAGTTGDYTLYVKRGGEPTTTSYDCTGGSTSGGAAACTFRQPQAGPWYVLLKAAAPENVYSGLTLVGRYTGIVRNLVLSHGQPVTDISATADDLLLATLEVPTGQRLLAFWMGGGTGLADLYIRTGSKPTESSYTCRASVDNACLIDNPQAGTWHVLVLPKEPLSGHTLTAGYKSAFSAATALENEQPTPALAGDPLLVRSFSLEVPPNQAQLHFTLNADTRGLMAYAKRGSAPTRQSFDCALPCKLDAPGSGTWFVKVWARAPYAGVTLTGRYTAPELLSNFSLRNLPRADDKTVAGNHYYRIDLPAGGNGLSVKTDGTRDDGLSLYVKQGSLPSPTDHDCVSAIANTSLERCDFFDPREGPWYALVTAPFNVYPTFLWSSITASYTETGPVAGITEGVPLAVKPSTPEYQTYQLELPPGRSSLQVELLRREGSSYAGGSVTVQHATAPTLFYNQCWTSSSCVIPTPAAGTWYFTVMGGGRFDGVLRVTSTSDVRQMVNGVWENPLRGNSSAGAMTYFKLEVPVGASHLNFRSVLTDLNARAADIYVRHGSKPTTWDYGCRVLARPPQEGNCDFPQPQAGTWYVGVNEFDGASLTRLVGTYAMTPDEGLPQLLSHGTVTNLSGPKGSQRFWTMEVPPGQRLLWFAKTGGGRLRAKWGARPIDGVTPDCFAQSTDLGEVCSVSQPAAGTWFVSLAAVDSAGAYERVSLTGAYVGTDTVTPLTNTVPVPNLQVGGGMPHHFKLEVPPGQAVVTFDVRFPAKEKGLLLAHLARDMLPSAQGTPCEESIAGLLRCQVLAPEGGAWYLRLAASRYSDVWYKDVEVVGAHGLQEDDARVILNGFQHRGVSGTRVISRTFKLMVPEGAGSMLVRVGTDGWPAYGIVSVSARKGSPPTATERACVSAQGTQTSCNVSTPEAGLWYVTVTPSDDPGGYHDMWLFVDAR